MALRRDVGAVSSIVCQLEEGAPKGWDQTPGKGCQVAGTAGFSKEIE